MRSLLSRRPSPALIVAMLALVVATSGVAVAANLGSDKVVYACVNQEFLFDDGKDVVEGLTIVTAPDGCEAATGGDYPDSVALNAPGPQGAQGPQGLVGAGGPGGPQGPAGQAAPAPAPPKVSPADAQKLAGSISKAQDKLDEGNDKIKDALKKIEQAKARGASQAQIEKMMEALNAMIAALLGSQQIQQSVLGSITSGVTLGSAQQKVKDAEKLKEGVEEATKQYEKADAAKEQQKALDEMIRKIIATLQKMQEAQSEQMKAIVRV